MVTKAEWAARVKRWGKSGLGREEFAKGEGIDAKQLGWCTRSRGATHDPM